MTEDVVFAAVSPVASVNTDVIVVVVCVGEVVVDSVDVTVVVGNAPSTHGNFDSFYKKR